VESRFIGKGVGVIYKMKNSSAHSAKSPAIWLVNPFTDWKANLVSAIQNVPRALFVCAALIVVLAFALPLAAQAQNNSANPYINSTQKYRVKMGNSTNTVTWELQNGSGPITAVTNSSTYGGETYINIATEPEGSDTYAYIEIKFLDGLFDNGDTWTLIYSEWNGTVGSGNCEAKRSVTINPVENTFYFSMGADASDCHPLRGEVLNWNDVDTETPGVNLDFTVTLHKTYNFNIKSYTFSGTVATTDYTFTGVTLGLVGGATLPATDYTIGYNTTNKTFAVTINVPPLYDGARTDDATVNIVLQVAVAGLVYQGDEVTVALTGGSATSGTNYTVNTDVEDPPPIGTNLDQELTILPLPATSNIAVLD
jgi:hypothetical protein